MKTHAIALIAVLLVLCSCGAEAQQIQVAVSTIEFKPAALMRNDPGKLPPPEELDLSSLHAIPVPRKGSGEFFAWSRKPELIKVLPPEYPMLAMSAGVEGRILLNVTVGSYGNVEAVAVIESDVTPAMEKAAIAAAVQFEFAPAMQRDMPVRSMIAVPVWFKLR